MEFFVDISWNVVWVSECSNKQFCRTNKKSNKQNEMSTFLILITVIDFQMTLKLYLWGKEDKEPSENYYSLSVNDISCWSHK